MSSTVPIPMAPCTGLILPSRLSAPAAQKAHANVWRAGLGQTTLGEAWHVASG
jgi:hypothetical protein